jgi:hypothetical protein
VTKRIRGAKETITGMIETLEATKVSEKTGMKRGIMGSLRRIRGITKGETIEETEIQEEKIEIIRENLDLKKRNIARISMKEKRMKGI